MKTLIAKDVKSGVILIDKVSGSTSHDVVSRIRKAMGIRRVGHCGTLDPLATGLLLICVGRYTRLSPWLTSADKEYVSTFEFGSQSDTDDADGNITKLDDMSRIEEELLKETLKSFKGPIMQVPPIYSAIRVGGQRSYKSARKGKNLTLEPIIFYVGAIFWTLGYDTIYGYQDIKDDEIIGVKSTSIKFKNNPKKFLSLCYVITLISIISIGLSMNFNNFYFLFLILPTMHLFFQIKILNIKDDNSCLKIFKSNNMLGLIIFINLLIGKLI